MLEKLVYDVHKILGKRCRCLRIQSEVSFVLFCLDLNDEQNQGPGVAPEKALQG